MTHVAFILTMPNRGSWNGQWSGENTLYCVVRKFAGKKGAKRAQTLARSYYYRWEDGWGANVETRIVDGETSREFRRKSQGFCGYEWMIESILAHGKILADHQVEDWRKEEQERIDRETYNRCDLTPK